jgi:Spy/CpxP family protein refolding chaperone
MKSMRIRLLVAGLAVLLGTALAKSQTAEAPPPTPMHGPEAMAQHMLDYFSKQLNLTDDQQTQARAIMQKEMPTLKPLIQQEHQIDQQVHQLAEGNYDAAKVQTLAKQKAQIDVQMTINRTRLHNELYQLLTPDQQTQLKQLEATHHAQWRKHMQNDGPPAPPEQ